MPPTNEAKSKYVLDTKTPNLLFDLPKTKPSPDEVFSNTDFEKNKRYFHIMPFSEPHAKRRADILKAHPEIK